MKGIVLAGGTGSRLWPMTRSVSKQLLPVYDKPMIYYPISTLMLAGIREILIITTPHEQPLFKELLGDGSTIGVQFSYEIQLEPKGLAQALTIGAKFAAGQDIALILGDNIFHGAGLGRDLLESFELRGAHILTYEVANPSSYGVLTVSDDFHPLMVEEKPLNSTSKLAITGLYFFTGDVCEIAKSVTPSARGELEITSVISHYLEKNLLTYTHLNRGVAWLDTGSPQTLSDAANYVRVIEERTGLKIGCIEEISLRNGWISKADLNPWKTQTNSYASYINGLD